MNPAPAENVTPITGIQAVQSFRTPDGRYFASEDEARKHLARDRFAMQAQAYVDSRDDWPKGTATRVKNVVCDYLAWAESQK